MTSPTRIQQLWEQFVQAEHSSFEVSGTDAAKSLTYDIKADYWILDFKKHSYLSTST